MGQEAQGMVDGDELALDLPLESGELAAANEVKLRYGLKTKNLPRYVKALERQGYVVLPPSVADSFWRRLAWALWPK